MSEKEKDRRKRRSSEAEAEERSKDDQENTPLAPVEENPEGDGDEEWIGPLPSAAAHPKKKKGKIEG